MEFLELLLDNDAIVFYVLEGGEYVEEPNPTADHLKSLDPENVALAFARGNSSLMHVAVTLYARAGPGFIWEAKRSEGQSEPVSLLGLGPYTEGGGEKSNFWKAPEKRV